MSVTTVVATANVWCDLVPAAAARALDAVLAHDPDLVGLQEWDWPRRGLLRARPAYRWQVPIFGGTAIGARVDRFALLGRRFRLLDGVGRGEREDRPWGLEPPRMLTIGTYRDLRDGREVSLLDYHLAPGVQRGGVYRADRPRLVARHRQELARLTSYVARELACGREVYAVGDGNFDRTLVAGLTSAWAGRDSVPGTLGGRTIDDVHGPGPADDVRLVATESDHRGVVVTRTRLG